ncbi:glycosyltransferase [Blautia sp.]|uniref:glycosyltransferase n=1 Tax=Blautia sp. TaxID=1955243 RepID=UPI003AB17B7E
MSNILLVAAAFPPDQGVGTLRISSLAAYMSKKDNIFLVTNRKKGELPAYIKRASFVDICTESGSFKNNLNTFRVNQKKYQSAVEGMIKECHPDIVIISGGPFFTFACTKTAKKHGVPSILDFRDPWIFDIREGWYSRSTMVERIVHLLDERTAVANATRVTTVTDGWVKLFKKFYPLQRSKFVKIENGYDDAIVESIKLDNPHTKMEDTLVITGFGKMFYYSDKYSLIFLQGLKKYLDAGKKANLLQVGSRESQADSLLNKANVAQDVLQTTGFVDYKVGVQKIAESDVCLIIDSRNHALGTKLYDYIFINRPILFVGPKNSDLSKMVLQFKNGFACTTGEEVFNALQTLKKNDFLSEKPSREQFKRERQNKLWRDLIYGLIKNEKTGCHFL